MEIEESSSQHLERRMCQLEKGEGPIEGGNGEINDGEHEEVENLRLDIGTFVVMGQQTYKTYTNLEIKDGRTSHGRFRGQMNGEIFLRDERE